MRKFFEKCKDCFFIVLIVVGTVLISIVAVNQQEQIWNNGYHVEDNGQWVYERHYHTRRSNGSSDTTYIYYCNKCGKEEHFLFTNKR